MDRQRNRSGRTHRMRSGRAGSCKAPRPLPGRTPERPRRALRAAAHDELRYLSILFIAGECHVQIPSFAASRTARIAAALCSGPQAYRSHLSWLGRQRLFSSPELRRHTSSKATPCAERLTSGARRQSKRDRSSLTFAWRARPGALKEIGRGVDMVRGVAASRLRATAARPDRSNNPMRQGPLRSPCPATQDKRQAPERVVCTLQSAVNKEET